MRPKVRSLKMSNYDVLKDGTKNMMPKMETEQKARS